MKVIISRPIRQRTTKDGKVRTWTSYEDVEFIFDKEYNKVFNPVFGDVRYDFDAKEENGIITFVLTPRSDIKPTEIKNQRLQQIN